MMKCYIPNLQNEDQRRDRNKMSSVWFDSVSYRGSPLTGQDPE